MICLTLLSTTFSSWAASFDVISSSFIPEEYNTFETNAIVIYKYTILHLFKKRFLKKGVRKQFLDALKMCSKV
jgi:hypothetical protein